MSSTVASQESGKARQQRLRPQLLPVEANHLSDLARVPGAEVLLQALHQEDPLLVKAAAHLLRVRDPAGMSSIDAHHLVEVAKRSLSGDVGEEPHVATGDAGVEGRERPG